jgi:hypothetical protein
MTCTCSEDSQDTHYNRMVRAALRSGLDFGPVTYAAATLGSHARGAARLASGARLMSENTMFSDVKQMCYHGVTP